MSQLIGHNPHFIQLPNKFLHFLLKLRKFVLPILLLSQKLVMQYLQVLHPIFDFSILPIQLLISVTQIFQLRSDEFYHSFTVPLGR